MAQKPPTGIKRVISRFLITRGFNRLRTLIGTQGNMKPEGAIDFVFSKPAELIQPWQFREEILGLVTEIHNINPTVVMEIGTANGGTLFLATRVAKPDATIISLDLPDGKFGGGYPEWKIPYYSSFALSGQKLHLLRADSHAASSLENVKKILNGREIDYLFIDGDHTYEGVKQDFEMYSPFVRKGGLIAFHDIVIHPGSTDVATLWHELKHQYDHREYVNDWNQGRFGVGILTKN